MSAAVMQQIEEDGVYGNIYEIRTSLYFLDHIPNMPKRALGLLCLELLKIQTVALLTKYTLIPFRDSVII